MRKRAHAMEKGPNHQRTQTKKVKKTEGMECENCEEYGTATQVKVTSNAYTLVENITKYQDAQRPAAFLKLVLSPDMFQCKFLWPLKKILVACIEDRTKRTTKTAAPPKIANAIYTNPFRECFFLRSYATNVYGICILCFFLSPSFGCARIEYYSRPPPSPCYSSSFFLCFCHFPFDWRCEYVCAVVCARSLSCHYYFLVISRAFCVDFRNCYWYKTAVLGVFTFSIHTVYSLPLSLTFPILSSSSFYLFPFFTRAL